MAERRRGASDATPGDDARTRRAAGERAADHAAIGRLTDELLPSLIAKLGASGLGELEVREGPWQVRLRGRLDGSDSTRRDRRRDDRPGRAHPGHEGHGHAPAALEAHRPGRGGGAASASDGRAHGDPADPSHRAVATSPAVGLFQPRSGVTAGTKVRSGDRLAHVEVLGIPQEVVAPVDGIVGASLVEAGQAVEYGQELILIELAGATAAPAAAAGAPAAAAASAPGVD